MWHKFLVKNVKPVFPITVNYSLNKSVPGNKINRLMYKMLWPLKKLLGCNISFPSEITKLKILLSTSLPSLSNVVLRYSPFEFHVSYAL